MMATMSARGPSHESVDVDVGFAFAVGLVVIAGSRLGGGLEGGLTARAALLRRHVHGQG